MKEVPADKKKSLGKLPKNVRNKMGYMNKGGMAAPKFKPCPGCPTPGKCAKEGCQKEKNKMAYGGMAKKKMAKGGMAKKGYNKGGYANCGASVPPSKKR